MPDTATPSFADTGIRPSARIPVRFSGDGAGTAELSWGQREIWRTMVRQRSWLPIGGWSRLAPGTTLDDVAAELRWAMRRYQPMRTRLRYAHDGRPLQAVADRGTIGLDVYDCPDGTDPAAFVVAIDAQDRSRPYDVVEEWPVRMGVVRHRGVPTHLSTVMCHLVTDGLGGRLFLREVADPASASPLTGTQPLEQAHWQASPAGQRQQAAALRHWERVLRRLPPPRTASTVDGPRYRRGEFRSTALPLATHVVSERTGADSSQVLMTFLALALGSLGGDPVVLRPMVSNRFRRGFETVVAMVAQRGICAADLGGVPFAEALRRVGSAAVGAYKYAYLDPDGVTARAAELAVDDEAGLWFNDRRVATRQGFSGGLPAADALRAAPGGDFRWTVAQDDPFDPLSVDVDDAPGGAWLLTVFTDTARLGTDGAEELVRAAERIAVREAVS
ncbi:condensation domain-containing protein [Dactylosporangium sp. AC04546]|uniref:condensation domain-containing protein n=1 Tax=Dactylosporangium sp. AC04546 TaxID=2862460 RepID=UPI001EDFC264|nr:condensation domain-containing protein [Dactylosporangium sp. AC04546]WVK86188.1 condensation domain-containing protein [Dactylosporangium sp. AC04546]